MLDWVSVYKIVQCNAAFISNLRNSYMTIANNYTQLNLAG